MKTAVKVIGVPLVAEQPETRLLKAHQNAERPYDLMVIGRQVGKLVFLRNRVTPVAQWITLGGLWEAEGLVSAQLALWRGGLPAAEIQPGVEVEWLMAGSRYRMVRSRRSTALVRDSGVPP
jgi:hypothetical protein